MNNLSFTWQRRGGYEVSSKGDRRFSAFNAKIKQFNNLTIEVLYQCTDEYGKGNDPVGLDWRKGKGQIPANGKTFDQLYEGYKELWRIWLSENMDLFIDLYDQVIKHNYVLSDCFATTPVNQARVLSELLNEFFGLD